ncbi:MAG: UDP-N-acetylmuramoyl-L-alanine--D-glutamate ligase [Lachnospiraceae bacterium]|nr:UDP-N-acetylmuramoyl-L-alanine--D-glutamate ligase [Lachnospiraceae bacterium]
METEMDIVQYLNGKRILIWGYGREGKSTESFLTTYCSSALIEVYEGDRAGIDEEKYDVIIKSPGIPMLEYNPKYTSQTELFLSQFRNQVVGVTGTKGKSTTSTMLYHVLSACSGKKTLLLGNIGKPCLDYYGEMSEDTIAVFELSCHQLFHTKVSPHVAVLLNIFEEHLDYYKTMDRYVASKHAIAKYQEADDFLYCGSGVDLSGVEAKAKRTVIAPVTEKKYELKILGEQNQYNAEFVYRIATEVFGCEPEGVKAALSEVGNLPHRLEFIGEKDGVRYYDDSIATIPEAVICAVAAIDRVQTVIIGGMDRGIDYSVLEQFIKDNEQYTYIFMYDTGKRIYGALEPRKNYFLVEDLEAAVKTAKGATAAGMACVMSPAAPSYGVFKNFEERGEKFKEYVMG